MQCNESVVYLSIKIWVFFPVPILLCFLSLKSRIRFSSLYFNEKKGHKSKERYRWEIQLRYNGGNELIPNEIFALEYRSFL